MLPKKNEKENISYQTKTKNFISVLPKQKKFMSPKQKIPSYAYMKF